MARPRPYDQPNSDRGASRYHGTPPHGGIALGLDRIVMVLAGGLCHFTLTIRIQSNEGACPSI